MSLMDVIARYKVPGQSNILCQERPSANSSHVLWCPAQLKGTTGGAGTNSQGELKTVIRISGPMEQVRART